MPDYYVRGATGNNANSGLSGALARQHHSSIASLSPAAGSVIYHAEQQEATAVATFTAGRCQFKNETGTGGITPAVIRGVTFPTAASWAASGVSSYVQNIGSGLSIAGVIDRWTQRIDSNRRRYCYLAPQTSQANVDANANSWFYDSVPGNLYIRTNDGTNPTTLTGEDRIGYITATVGGLVVQGGYMTIEDLSWEFVRAAGSSPNYQLQTNNGNNIIRRCSGWDASVHHVTCLESVNDVIEDCVFHGGGQILSGSESNTPIALYSAAGHVTGGRIRRTHLHCYTHLTPAGTPINSSSTCSNSGIKVHTDGAGGRQVRDVELEDTWSYHYGQVGQLIDCSDTGSAPTNRFLFNSYPVRIVRGGQRGSRGHNQFFNAAFKNTFFDLTGATSTTDLYMIWIQAGYIATFLGCTFVFDQGNQAGRSMFRVENGAELNLVNCTIINKSTNSGGPHTVCLCGTTSFKLRWHRSIFKNAYLGGVSTRLIGGDSGAAAANYEMSGNVYHGFDSTKFSNDTSRDTQAEWLASVDTTGQVIDPKFANINSTDPLVAGQLLPSSPLLVPSRKINVPGYIAAGINGRAYDGTIGAHQGGQVIANRVNSIAAGLVVGRAL